MKSCSSSMSYWVAVMERSCIARMVHRSLLPYLPAPSVTHLPLGVTVHARDSQSMISNMAPSPPDRSTAWAPTLRVVAVRARLSSFEAMHASASFSDEAMATVANSVPSFSLLRDLVCALQTLMKSALCFVEPGSLNESPGARDVHISEWRAPWGWKCTWTRSASTTGMCGLSAEYRPDEAAETPKLALSSRARKETKISPPVMELVFGLIDLQKSQCAFIISTLPSSCGPSLRARTSRTRAP